MLAYFLSNSRPSACARFVSLLTFWAWAQHSRCTYCQVELLPSWSSRQTEALCVRVTGGEAQPGDVSPQNLRGEEGEPVWCCIATIRPFTEGGNLSPSPWQCQWQPKAVGIVSLWRGRCLSMDRDCPTFWFLAQWCLCQGKKSDLPKPSDSNRQVSPTPTSRHQARKFAVLSRAKKDPEGALRRHGILREGMLCHRHRDVSAQKLQHGDHPQRSLKRA